MDTQFFHASHETQFVIPSHDLQGMQEVYCISGLGADDRIFQHLQLSGYALRHVRWIKPALDDTWESYARRLLDQIPDPQPILLGMSMGGMMAVELSKIVSARQVILISSAKSCKELPFYFRWLRILPVHRWIPYSWLIQIGLWLGPWLFGPSGAEEAALLKDIVRQTDKVFFRWAWTQISRWRNLEVPNQLFHIHGNRDHMLPIAWIHPDLVVSGGTHLMILGRASEIGSAIERVLGSLEPVPTH